MKDSPQAVWLTLDDKPHRFSNTEEAQAFLDSLPSRRGIEFVHAPLLFQLLNAPGAPFVNLPEIRAEIVAKFGSSTSSEYRSALLQTFKAVMDLVEASISDPKHLSDFRSARANDYHLLVMQESLVDGYVCIEVLHEVTTREMAAGRMTPDHKLRKLAEEEIGKPHFTKEQLLQGAMKNAQEEPAADVASKKPEVRPKSIWHTLLVALRLR